MNRSNFCTFLITCLLEAAPNQYNHSPYFSTIVFDNTGTKLAKFWTILLEMKFGKAKAIEFQLTSSPHAIHALNHNNTIVVMSYLGIY